MLSWLGKRLVDYQLARLSAGDLRLTLWMDAADVQMTFPGDSSSAVVQAQALRGVGGHAEDRGVRPLARREPARCRRGLMATVEVSAGPIEYTDTGGDGRVLVLLHGLATDGRLWDGVVASLGDQW